MRTGLVAAIAALTLMISAGAAGAAVAGKQCGGFIGIQCPAGQFCQHRAGTCFFFDAFGACTRIPRFCPRIYRPVCGCDNKTYSNDCVRQSAGVSKSHDGKCTF